MHSNTHRQNIHISLFCAIICILSQISIPTPFGVPVTLQILAISLCGYILGYKNALKTVAVYILLGMLGLPVFANFKGGIPALLGPTGGFVAGFVFVAFFCGLNKKHKIIWGIFGVVILHIIGIFYFSFITKTSILTTFLSMSFYFIIKDIVSVILSYFISVSVKKALKF